MIDTSKAKWELSHEEKVAIKWFNENGFDGELTKQFKSKTYFSIQKDGVKTTCQLPQGFRFNAKKFMELWKDKWEMLCKLEQMEKKDKIGKGDIS